MDTAVQIQSPASLLRTSPVSQLEAELQELEDTYAECLGDNVDAQTLTQLWTRIKAIKKQIAFHQYAVQYLTAASYFPI